MILDTIAWSVVILSSLAGCALLVFLLHRLCLRLEARGFLYYRRRPEGSMSSVFQEVDRLTRPSIEHVEEFRDEARIVVNDDHAGD